MVKTLFFLSLLATFVYSKSIELAIKDVIGKKSYNSKKKLIEVLFKDSSSYRDDNFLKYEAILQKLRDEGLLKLKKTSSPLRVAFTTNQKNLQVFIKVIKDTLYSLGFNNLYTIKSIRRGKKFIWIVSLGNNYMLDPLLFAKSMKEKNIFIEDMKRYSPTNWNYTLNIKEAVVVPKKLEYNDIIKLQKSMRPYWLNIEGGNKVEVSSDFNNRWHPLVILYNKDLHIISSMKKNNTANKMSINIPSDAVYIKIDDVYSMKNIKDGLSILIQKRE